jgi:hypothetical protein
METCNLEELKVPVALKPEFEVPKFDSVIISISLLPIRPARLPV